MNEHLVSKIINLYVVKLSNSGAHVYLTMACVSRLDLDHYENNLIRPDLIRGSLGDYRPDAGKTSSKNTV